MVGRLEETRNTLISGYYATDFFFSLILREPKGLLEINNQCHTRSVPQTIQPGLMIIMVDLFEVRLRSWVYSPRIFYFLLVVAMDLDS